ncbi:hypothetical protein BJ508DRAFT_373926 [Ascobolus immersus RN42]|uniref:Uncharacterized protein n=1 Tax=Ascobolus immersus RN42 TaxID=1160509 RepID=A0A3N4IH11_ASCIM|nr:hypothetical protein BJ508DRAFT_373926 [Ascobolus immersus RN42]
MSGSANRNDTNSNAGQKSSFTGQKQDGPPCDKYGNACWWRIDDETGSYVPGGPPKTPGTKYLSNCEDSTTVPLYTGYTAIRSNSAPSEFSPMNPAYSSPYAPARYQGPPSFGQPTNPYYSSSTNPYFTAPFISPFLPITTFHGATSSGKPSCPPYPNTSASGSQGEKK